MRKWTLNVALVGLAFVLPNCGAQDGALNDSESENAPAQERTGTVSQAFTGTTATLSPGGYSVCSVFGGRVLCWGANDTGQLGTGVTGAAPDGQIKPVFVSGITTATAVTSGDKHHCALLSNGTMKCWGWNNSGQLGNGTTTTSSLPVSVSGISTATQISAGKKHTCARLSNSTLKCWGYNQYGQLGNGTTSNQLSPVTVSSFTDAAFVSGGEDHTCALRTGGAVKCWGTRSRVGDGQSSGLALTPLSVTGLTSVTAIATGEEHTCARRSDSTLRCWGGNFYGQVGDGTSGATKLTPVTVSGITTALGITSGEGSSCALLSNGTAKCWGANNFGQLGNGTSTASSLPVAVSGLTGVSGIAVGGSLAYGAYACASLGNGGIKCWGNGTPIGLVSPVISTGPVPRVLDETVWNHAADIASGSGFDCVTWDTSSVKCWGDNTFGQLGNGTTTRSDTPASVTGLGAVASIAAGTSHACAVLNDGTVKCWGSNAYGQLGNGGSGTSSTPVNVSGITNATQVSLATNHSCARLADSTLRCWGNNSWGQLGDGTTTNSAVPVMVTGITDGASVATGGEQVGQTKWWPAETAGHTCAVVSAGAVKCWGTNWHGELGNGTTASYVTGGTGLERVPTPTPVAVSNLTGATQLSLSAWSSCAFVSGSAKCWGGNPAMYEPIYSDPAEQLVPVDVSGISGATSITGGSRHQCARLSNRKVACWGLNFNGQLGDGTTVYAPPAPVEATGVSYTGSVSASGMHTCARNVDSTVTCWGNNVASFGTFTTPMSANCSVVDVERSDYFVNFTTANMPDTALNGKAAQLDTHRVKPVLFPSSCAPTQAVVMVHGRTVDGTTAFDLQHQSYSAMESFAKAGIDTFTVNHLGMGRSKITTAGSDAMSNACNASLPHCVRIGQTCPPPVGVLCDCGPVTFGPPTATPVPAAQDQQGTTRFLNPNPLASRCAHTSGAPLINATTMVTDLDLAVNDALSKSGLAKVSLLGYSAGGIDVGNYLGVADNTLRAARTAKVDKAVFISSLFALPDTEPPSGNASFPLSFIDRNAAVLGGFNLDLTACPGQKDSSIEGPLWAAIKARDTVGSGWGPTQTPSENGGLSRYPEATRWGWNATSAARVSVPVLVMHGLRDNVVPVASSASLYSALTGTTSKTIVQIGCASHSLLWEACTGAQCNGWKGPHYTVFRNARDWIRTGMIYASPGSNNGSFESDASDGINEHTSGPTSSGPPADEGNLTP